MSEPRHGPRRGPGPGHGPMMAGEKAKNFKGSSKKLLHDPGGLHRMHPDSLVKFLTVAATLYRVHHDVLRSHKGQLPKHVLTDHLGIYHQAVSHIVIQIQNAVHCQESFRNADALIGRIVQCALEPLSSHSHGGVDRVGNDIPGQGSDALAAHGIALIRHSGRTDLAFLKRLFHFLQMLQQPDIVGELGGALGNAGKDVQHLAVQLPGISLARDGETLFISHLLGDLPIQFPALFVVALKQL